ncbi:interleukin-5 [Sorex araneus]|uniref:interleukin-5 n=1 Tax=Sorex araneus TaxID=42254 RepID=UPI000331477C|nr:interleukin-5 [Sorex araneus]
MKMILRLSLLALGAAYACAFSIDKTMNGLVAETLTLLSTHQTLLTSNETLWIPNFEHKNHLLCIEEVFQEIDYLKNQTAQGETVEKLFQNLFLIKEMIKNRKCCRTEKSKVKPFLDYLQEFLGVINSELPMESDNLNGCSS